MYRALYRKWRPLTFGDVIGQDNIVAALQNQIKADKIGHAYIFTGTRGTGKTTCAKIFAKAVNCPNTTDGDACGKCEICKGVETGSLLDVVEIDAASNNGVDNIRDLRDETAYTPSESRYKVYIIDEVHMLSTAAFNALLKIMEEPPDHIIFILATTEIHKVPATILSRCQRYDFMRISPPVIAERLKKIAVAEEIKLSPEAAELISLLADGAMRDALSILDTCAGVSQTVDEALVRRMAGVTDKSYLFEISNAVKDKNSVDAVVLLSKLRERSIDTKHLTEELISHYRNLMLSGVAGYEAAVETISAADSQKYAEVGKQYKPQECIAAIKRLGACLERMAKGADQRIELELAVFDLCGTSPVYAPVYSAPASSTQPGKTTAKPQAAESTAAQNEPAQEPNAVSAAADETAPKTASNVKGAAQDVPFTEWPDVLARLAATDNALHSFLRNSSAYISGRRILIDAGAMFTNYIRQNDYSRDLIKSAISEVTGERYSIGPYEKKSAAPQTAEEDENLLTRLKNMGVDVIEN